MIDRQCLSWILEGEVSLHETSVCNPCERTNSKSILLCRTPMRAHQVVLCTTLEGTIYIGFYVNGTRGIVQSITCVTVPGSHAPIILHENENGGRR